MGLLPADPGALGRGAGLEIHAVLEPARQVGGDLYEVLRLGEDRLLVALGDVSGKGIPAALFMAVTMTLLRTMARQNLAPGEILRRVNDELLEQNARGMFVTLQCTPRGRGEAVRRHHGRVGPAGLARASNQVGVYQIGDV